MDSGSKKTPAEKREGKNNTNQVSGPTLIPVLAARRFLHGSACFREMWEIGWRLVK
jgi:hypothetical protein